MKKILLFAVLSILLLHHSYATVFDCNSTSDANGNSSTRTLRYCITQANLTSAKDTINFSVAGTWTVGSNYPVISYPLCINGFTAPLAVQGQLGTGVRQLKVILNGGGSSTVYGFQITAANCEIKGLVIQNFFKGVFISGSLATNNWVWGNYIGTSADGLSSTLAEACYDDGIGISSNASYNIIGTNGDGSNDANEGNLISANGDGGQFNGEGISINEGGSSATDCTGNKIAGNYLGTNETGNAALYTTGLNTQRGSGVQINYSTANLIGTNGDGVSDVLERNLISGNTDVGIVFIGGGSNKIKGNYIGSDKTGLIGLPNYANGGTGIIAVQISIKTGSNNNIIGTDGDGVGDNIEGNIIGSATFAAGTGGGSYNYGVFIQACTGTRIAANKIGIGADGTTALNIVCTGAPYIDKGIYISSGSTSTIVGTNGDGVSDSYEPNYFGNTGQGVAINSSSSCVVAGNYFGLGTNLTTAETLSSAGAYVIDGTSCRIGSSATNSLERNYFCNSSKYGVWIERTSSNTDNHIVRYNTLGVRPDNVAAPNAQSAIILLSNTNSDTINNNIITKNGTASASGAYGAIQIGLTGGSSAGSQSSVISNNLIYKNIGPAISIYVNGSKKNLITQNSIYNNGNASDATGKLSLGIDLNGDGVTANDSQDPDNGPNDYSNFPIITGAVPGGAGCSQQVQGTLNALPSTQYYIEVFSNDVCNGDTSGINYYSNLTYNYGEGKTYLSTSSTFTTDASGNGSWNVAVPFSSVAGKYVTATAIQANGTSLNCTSEFSKCYYVTFDAGDAPDTYKTLIASCGPIHLNLSTNLVIGSSITADSDGQPSAQANLDVDDGINTFPTLTNKSTSYSLSNIPVINTTGSSATLYAWIDFNGNGLFEAGEYSSSSVANGATSATLTWNLSSFTCEGTLKTGVSYLRMRLTTDALIDNAGTTNVDERSYGQANDGEVEDYKLYIAGVDYGDLNISYPVATAASLQDTALAKVWAGITKPSTECTQKFSADAYGDGPEEDGLVTSFGGAASTNTWLIKLNANQANKTVYYGFWIDWDANSNFTSALDIFYSGSAVVNGVTNVAISVTVPVGYSTSANFRLIVSDAPITSTMYNATITNGEVEDYSLLLILHGPGNLLAGSRQSAGNLLKWKNSSGISINKFIVERSDDNLTWHELGFLNTTSTDNVETQYSYSDIHPFSERNYYRLKLMYTDSSFQYSNIVYLADNNNYKPVIIFPNPAKNILTIQNSNAGYTKLKVMDVTGRLEFTQEITLVNTNIDISKLSPGTHFIKFISQTGEENILRFVKLK